MSAEVLRRAAALMRERAEAATEGPWVAELIGSEGWHVYGPPGANHPERPKLRPRTAAVTWGSWQSDKADAEHIASWHPAVALAVADLLEAIARAIEHVGTDHADAASIRDEAVRFARAYLGGEA